MIYANYNGVEQYPQIKDIIEGLRTASCNISDELKNTTDNRETIIKSEITSLEEVKKIQFLMEQMTHNSAYVSTTMNSCFLVPKKLNTF